MLAAIITGSTTRDEITDYVRSGGKKIMVTYDSVPKVQETLGLGSKRFRLLVDEFHKLISYMDVFKPTVVRKLLEKSSAFKSISYLTATPTDYKWLPQPMKELDLVQFEWEDAVKPDLVHCYIKEGMVEKVLATLLDTIDSSNDEVYVFYNSKVGAMSLLQKLFKCRKDISLKDVNILFAENKENTDYFKKHLGKEFKYGEIPTGFNNKRINIISSMGFEGIDYYPNALEQREPTSIVVSDPNTKSMRYDISVDLVQILGRFRKHPVTNDRIRNKVIYLWNTQRTDYNLNEEQFLAKVKHDIKESIETIEIAKTNSQIERLAISGAKKEHHILIEDNKLLLHPYGLEAQMSAYKALHCDATVLKNNIVVYDKNNKMVNTGLVSKDSVIVSKLSDLRPDISTYIVPVLSSIYTKALGRVPSVTKLVREWESLEEDWCENYNDLELRLLVETRQEFFLIQNPSFNEWIDSGISTATMKTLGLNRIKIDTAATESRTIKVNNEAISHYVEIVIGQSYTTEELKNKIQQFYDDLNISKTSKGSDIKQWYDIKATTILSNNKHQSGYKILGPK